MFAAVLQCCVDSAALAPKLLAKLTVGADSMRLSRGHFVRQMCRGVVPFSSVTNYGWLWRKCVRKQGLGLKCSSQCYCMYSVLSLGVRLSQKFKYHSQNGPTLLLCATRQLWWKTQLHTIVLPSHLYLIEHQGSTFRWCIVISNCISLNYECYMYKLKISAFLCGSSYHNFVLVIVFIQ